MLMKLLGGLVVYCRGLVQCVDKLRPRQRDMDALQLLDGARVALRRDCRILLHDQKYYESNAMRVCNDGASGLTTGAVPEPAA